MRALTPSAEITTAAEISILSWPRPTVIKFRSPSNFSLVTGEFKRSWAPDLTAIAAISRSNSRRSTAQALIDRARNERDAPPGANILAPKKGRAM